MGKLGITTYSIPIGQQTGTCEPIRVIFLSDLHNCCIGKNNEKLLEAIDSISPEFILIGGDLVSIGGRIHKHRPYFRNALALLKELASKYRVYMVYGNHEQKFEWYSGYLPDQARRLERAIRKTGTILLRNKNLTVHCKGYQFSIAGFELPRTCYKRFRLGVLFPEKLEEDLGKKSRSGYQILLAHNPEYFPVYTKWGADLILSGHNHGGLIRIPGIGGLISPKYLPFPHYDAGWFEKEDSTMILGRGLGSHSLMLRVNNPPELVVLEFTGEKQK